MAGSDSHKPLLTLIRDFSSEKTQGERRIVNQRKRIQELTSELEASNAELEGAKRDKETTEQDLKGYEVQLSMNDASIEAVEARIALTNNEISKLGSELAALKSEENSSRDGFIEKMLELNQQIRKFQELLATTFNAENYCKATLDSGSLTAHEEDTLKSRVVSENKLAQITTQADQSEQQYKAEQVIHDQIQHELIDLEKKASLLESVMKQSMELQELNRYPCILLVVSQYLTPESGYKFDLPRHSKQTSELEEKCAALGDKLQKRFLCPRCHQDNSEELGEILQMSDGI
ncbi:hypothetical protein BUALT_Bualt04G0152400 [Buddleja alternifolia]|uniref:Uncharacterized protein n=1 Tax=Buddleja alternifolia TaxID=168488 RepID=A0AAV6XR95_9LAMI|nr:hypothetical protein BUALT_Bualt04G0152400 [Buddleja alternifolia]